VAARLAGYRGAYRLALMAFNAPATEEKEDEATIGERICALLEAVGRALGDL
jgi:hypothetical protein